MTKQALRVIVGRRASVGLLVTSGRVGLSVANACAR